MWSACSRRRRTGISRTAGGEAPAVCTPVIPTATSGYNHHLSACRTEVDPGERAQASSLLQALKEGRQVQGALLLT